MKRLIRIVENNSVPLPWLIETGGYVWITEDEVGVEGKEFTIKSIANGRVSGGWLWCDQFEIVAELEDD